MAPPSAQHHGALSVLAAEPIGARPGWGPHGELSRPWRPLRLVDFVSGPATDAIFAFSMSLARDGAWRFAQQLATLSDGEREARIAARDVTVAALGQRIHHPGLPASALLRVVRVSEWSKTTTRGPARLSS